MHHRASLFCFILFLPSLLLRLCRKEALMFFVPCPNCGTPAEIPADAIGLEREDPWNVISCFECGIVFDYEDCEVQSTETSE